MINIVASLLTPSNLVERKKGEGGFRFFGKNYMFGNSLHGSPPYSPYHYPYPSPHPYPYFSLSTNLILTSSNHIYLVPSSSSHSTSTLPLSADSTSTNTGGKQYYRKVVLSDMGFPHLIA